MAILSILISLLASFLAIKLGKPIAYKIGLVDIPNHRKLHEGEVPLIGGVAVFVGVLTSSIVLYPQGNILNLYLISSALIVFVGVLDDYRDLPVATRLFAQILVSSIMVYGADLHLSSLGNLFLLGQLDMGWLGYPLTVLAVIAAINAFNMSDGIDGLAGSLSVVSFVSLAVLMLLSNSEFSLLPILLAFATLPYLAFNLGLVGGKTKKVFMGDAGSMFVGLSVVWLLILGSQSESPSFRPVTALWLIAVPFWDMCAITIKRIVQGRNPFKPDRDHLHHIFLRIGYSAKHSLVAIVSFSTLCAGFGLLGECLILPESLMFALFIGCFMGYYYALKHIWKLTKLIKVKKQA